MQSPFWQISIFPPSGSNESHAWHSQLIKKIANLAISNVNGHSRANGYIKPSSFWFGKNNML